MAKRDFTAIKNSRYPELTLLLLPQRELLPHVHALCSDRRIPRHMNWRPHTGLGQTREFFRHCARQLRSGQGYEFLVRHSVDGYIGVTSLIGINPHTRTAEVATWLSPQVWGRGFNKVIKHILFQFAFGRCGLNKLCFRVSTGNAASLKSHRKLHTKLEGFLREEILVNGKPADCYYFGLLKSDYRRHYEQLKLSYRGGADLKGE